MLNQFQEHGLLWKNVHYVDYGFFLCGLFDLICASMFITIDVLYVILKPQLSVFNKGVKRKCMNHIGFLWACKSQNFQLPLKMKASQRNNLAHSHKGAMFNLSQVQ
jgi:hypothetical protein